MRGAPVVMVLCLILLPSASAVVGVDARPFVGEAGVVLPGQSMHTTYDSVPGVLALNLCGGDAITHWTITVTIAGMTPLDEISIRAPSGEVQIATFPGGQYVFSTWSPTTCMPGVQLDATRALGPAAWTVQGNLQ